MTGPLRGLLVADFTRVLSGPMATMTLADLGADVIKVERPNEGDETREWGPPFVDGVSAYYLSVNRNKRSMAIDLGTDSGLKAARTLVEQADVLVENFRPGTMARFGLDYDQVAERNPGLIYCSISGFGLDGGRDLPGYDFLVQATGGLMSITGYPDAEPVKVGVAIVDVLTGLNATIGILAALHDRTYTGQGQRVDVDLLSSLLAGLVNQASSYLVSGEPPRRMGNQHPGIAPYETLRSADRPIIVAVGNDRQFARLCKALHLESLLVDRRFARNRDRVVNRKDLVAALEARFLSAPADHWVEILMGAGVPSGRLNDIAEAFAFAEHLGLRSRMEMLRPDGTVVPQTASPLRLSSSPIQYRLPPPVLGEHTDEVMRFLDTPDQ